MTKSEYRNSCKDGVTFSDLKDDPEYYRDGEELILVSEVEQIIDDIESDVNDIIYILEDIKGLEEIDNAKKLLEDLSYKLY